MVKALKARAKRTGITPVALLNRPRLQPKDVPFRDAFYALSNSRPASMGGAGAIPVSEVLAYLQLVGIVSVAARSKYLRLVQAMDQVFLDHMAQANSTPVADGQ